MADLKHLEILKKGVEFWNKWRQDNPDISIDLSEADLKNAELKGANLQKANLERVNLRGSNLEGANLEGANLKRANLQEAILFRVNLSGVNLEETNLKWADLRWADFWRADLNGANLLGTDLSGAIIDVFTLRQRIKGVKIGINGIYCAETESAALVKFDPPGDSMLAPNDQVIIKNLEKAQKFLWYSLMLSLLILIFPIFSKTELKFPWVEDLILSPEQFLMLSLPFSFALLTLCNTFFNDGLEGTRYIADRNSAMSVGKFPWVLSRYAGQSVFNKIISAIIRFIMSYHPIIYLFIYFKYKFLIIPDWIYLVSVIILLFISTWTFIISLKFQKPILFDNETEKKRSDDFGRIVESINDQTRKIEDVLKTLRSYN